MENKDIRWLQRFNNFSKALSQLDKFVARADDLNELEIQGLIQAFEYNFELAWNVIKDYYEYQGASGIQGSRDAFRMAYNRGLINDGEDWMSMVQSRTMTSHTYNQETANEIANAVLEKYHGLFKALHARLQGIIDEMDEQKLDNP